MFQLLVVKAVQLLNVLDSVLYTQHTNKDHYLCLDPALYLRPLYSHTYTKKSMFPFNHFSFVSYSLYCLALRCSYSPVIL